jgi:D-alanyl-D-alanine carboxypeptidase
MRKHILLVLIIASLILAACGGAAPQAAPIPEAPAATETAPAGETAPSPETDAADADVAEADAEAAALQTMAAGISANPWKWTSFSSTDEEFSVEEPTSYIATFKDDGTVEIKADCNNASGAYTLDGVDATVEIGPATLALCADDSRSEQFLQLLGDAAQMLPLGDQLFITQKTDDGTMILDAVVTTVADLCGEEALAINTIEDTLAPEVSAMLDQGLVSLVQDGARPGPGASMLIITPEGRYFKSTGVADVTACDPLPADSPFQIGSNTKMMTSAMLFQLQEEGVLSTTDLLSAWLPDLAAQLPNGDAITIDMLLTHTSGLHDYFDVPTADGTTIEDGAKDKAMLTRGFTPEELVTLVADSGLSDFEPGAEGRWKYSNTGYILLGLIIEEATGKSYEENLNARILEPLGLTQTYLQTGQPEAGRLPQAYFKSPFDFTTREWNASQGWSAGAVVSTPEEFSVFLKALFTGRLFNDPATLDLMQEHTDAGVNALGEGTVYAHGVFDNNGVLGHGGQTLGFQSEGGYIPDKDVTIVIWSNAAESNVAREIVPAIAGAVVGGDPAGQTDPAGQNDPAGQVALPRFEPLDECFAQPPADLPVDLDLDCGYVVVPEARSGNSSREVKLGVTRINSGQGSANSPLFMLAGGPGQAQIDPGFFSLLQTDLLGGILASRDIVVVEQRGTEHTDPFLNCPEIISAPWAAYEQGLTGDDASAYEIGTVQACISRFEEEGINFDNFNSVENAADVNAVREALGYDRIIYYGASYGSQLGQHVMRDFPEILEAVVLDGANSLSRKSWVEDRALDAQWGLDNLTALCAADEKCAAAYDIPALVDAALALFDDGPLPFTYTDPDDPALTIEGEVTAQDMADYIYGQQGSRIGTFSLPALLSVLTEGGADQVVEILGAGKAEQLIAGRDADTDSITMLMHLAMVCSDDPVHSAAEVILDGVGAYAALHGQGLGEFYEQLCSLINVTELPDATDVDVTTDVPTLLLTGDLDVATPTFRSQIVADALPNATLVTFPGTTHVQIGGINLCAAQVMTQFVLDPTAELDMSCVEETTLLGFVLPDGSMSQE